MKIRTILVVILLTVFATLGAHNIYLAHVKRVQEEKDVQAFLKSLDECQKADNPFNCEWRQP